MTTDSAGSSPSRGLDTRYEVDGSDRDAFERHGHVTLRGVASRGEVDAYAPALRRAVRARPPRQPSDTEGEVYARAFSQYENLWRVDEGAARFALAPRFAGIAAQLLGVERVRLYHDQALFKEAGGGHTPWHQDKHYWPLDTDRAITMWMPLVDVTQDMGELIFARGSHRHGNISDLPISADADRIFEGFLDQEQSELGRTGTMRAGDASFHHAWTLHSASANRTGTRRDVMTVIWFADGARVTTPANDGQRSDLATWLPGLVPGDLAASELNPLIRPMIDG